MGRLDDPHFEGKLLRGAADGFTVLLLTAGSAMAVLSGYRLDVDQSAVLAFCVLAAVVSTVLHSLPRPWWSVAAAVGIGGIFWLKWEDISPILQQIGQKMNLLPNIYMGWSSRWEEALLPVFLLLCAALAWIMGWMAVRVRRWYLTALLSFILVLPAIQTGVLPSWGAMLAAFAGWGSMLLTALYDRKDPGSLGRAQLLSLTGMAALLMLLVMTLPMEGYVRPQWATDARTSLILGVRQQLEHFFDMDALESGILADLGIDLSVPGSGSGQSFIAVSGSGASGSSSAGDREDLLAAGPRRYSGRRVLSVTTDQPDGGRIYLRGGSLGTYTGASWEMIEEGDYPFFSSEVQEAEAQPMLYAAQTAADGTEYTMNIRDYNYGGIRYYPYRLTDGPGLTDEAGKLVTADGGVVDGLLPFQGSGYRVDYVPGGPEDGFVPLSGELAKEEDWYQAEVVYSYRYLGVPERARMVLEPLLDRDAWETTIASMQWQIDASEGAEREALEAIQQSLREAANRGLTLESFGSAVDLPEDAVQYQWPLTAASRTAALLAKLAVYDPDTPAMEDGEDFVTHFLTEGRGYCIHFATAGALLLRMQGIPARYVTGYTVQLNSQGRGTALDSDAHAWVEIYLDGYGWYPVEMTPGYTGGANGVSLADEAEEEVSDLPDEQAPEEDEPEEELPEETPDQENGPEETLTQEEEPEEAVSAAGFWRALAGIGLAACTLGALYALALLLRRRERTGADANRSVICAYRRYQRVLRLGGVEDETLEELGRKAKFSQHTLTEEERETAWRCLDEAVKTAQERQKKNLRWLLPLLCPAL